MSERIPQSVAIRVPLKAYLATDRVSAATGLTLAVQISKNGGAFGNPNAGATNATGIANGWYYVDLGTVDANTVGPLIVRGTAATCDPVEVAYNVVAFVEQTGDAFARLGAPAGASTAADIAAIKAVDDAIKAKTDSLTFTVAGMADANVVDWKGATAPAMTGDAYARLGAPAGASVSADVAAVKVDTAAVKVKTDFLPSATAGAAGGVFVAGTNAATAITTGLTAHIIGTVDTVTTYTGNTPQTGDSFARLGVAGAGLTALGDTRIAHLDADVSSRSTFAGGAVSSVTGSVGSVASYGTLVADVATAVWGAGTRTLTSFGTLVADTATAVWAATTRLLTAGDNIVLAKGVGLTGLNDIVAIDIVSNGPITTSAGKVSEVALVDELYTYIGNTLQTADVGTRIPANIAMTGSAVWALDDNGNPIAPASDTTTLITGVNVTQIGGSSQSSFVDVPAVLADLSNGKVGTGVNYGSGYTVFNNIYDLMVVLAAVKSQTDLLPGSPAATGDIPSAATIADAVRDVDNSTPAAGSLGEAVRGADAKAAEIKDLIGTPDVTVSDDIAAVMARLGAPAGASISADVAALLAAIDALPDPDFDAAADALLDRADAVEVGLTPRQYMRLTAAVLGGKLSGANTATNVFRNAVADDKDRVTATADSHGNRSAIVTDLA